MSIDLSVVICTHNRYASLGEAIASIEIQDCPFEYFELIIVDNSTDQATKENFAANLDISCQNTIIFEDTAGLSRARNIGVRAAKGQVVAFMDDDARASSHWVTQLISAFHDNPRAAIIGGPVRPIWPTARPPWLHPWMEGYLTIIDRGPDKRELAHDEWLAGTNIAFRREPLIDVGLFNENLGRIGKLLLSNEELSVSTRLRERGYTMLYDPAAEMFHSVHADRIDQGWMRRRIFWQVVSDLFSHGAEPGDFTARVSQILDYQMKLPPKERGLSGLFLNTDDPELFYQQTEALATFIRLIATDGQDWRAFLDTKLQ
jgi:glycosyltransferase involved in cell wall biosynthesis